ncbi:TPA: hypothetical protein DCZ39_07355 [Patescibacteria group bacterium]|nr:hypothetical protein [Candidatus Gracilibacteria bacterium]
MFVGRKLIFESIDFDDISGMRYITDRFDLSIDDSIFERQSYSAMHGKSKIQNSAAYRQFYDISLRCIQKDMFLEDLDIEIFFELFFVIQRFIVSNDIL